MLQGLGITWLQLLLWFLIGVGISILVFVVLRWLAIMFENPVIKLFNRWWRPIRMLNTASGARLEMVVSQNKKATVWWNMAIRGIGMLIMLSSFYALLLAMTPAFQALFFKGNPMDISKYRAWTIGIFVLVVSVVLLFTYFILEWMRRNKRLVVFTDETYYVFALPAPLGFLPFVKSKRVIISSGPTYLFEEILVASDVQDIGGQRTSSLRDRWTEYLAEKEGAGSIQLPSRVVGAQDTVTWVSHAEGTASCLRALSKASKTWQQKRDIMDRAETVALIGNPEEPWLEDDAIRKSEEIRERREILFPETDEQMDLFSVKDPGIWDKVLGREVRQEIRQDPDIISRIFTRSNQTENPLQEVFEDLWKKLSRKQTDVTKAGFEKDEVYALFQQYNLSPQELAHLIINEGNSKQEILERCPLAESEDQA